MTDKEKVIKGLESLYTRLLDAATRDRIAMLDAIIVADALALLKAQEPRVMTATEAYTADYVYIEFDGVITPAIRTTNERDGHRESYFATQQLGGDWMRWDDYGITWRCWTSRPTEAELEAVKWDG